MALDNNDMTNDLLKRGVVSQPALQQVADAGGDVKYLVIHNDSGAKVGGPYSTMQRARNARDRLDDTYGGYAHSIQPIQIAPAAPQPGE